MIRRLVKREKRELKLKEVGVVYGIAVVVDIVSTLYLLSIGYAEVNPMVAGWQALIVKAGVSTLIFIYAIKRRDLLLCVALAALQIGIVISNVWLVLSTI